MKQKLSSKQVRLSIQISPQLKDRLLQTSALQGKKVSVLVRESIEEHLNRIKKKMVEEKMKQAYLDMAHENLQISKDFEWADSENLC